MSGGESIGREETQAWWMVAGTFIMEGKAAVRGLRLGSVGEAGGGRGLLALGADDAAACCVCGSGDDGKGE